MTAMASQQRRVNGLRVVSDAPTRAPIADKAGGEVLWHQTRTLTLEDGTVVYGCQHCPYVSPNVHSVRPHLGHCQRKPSAVSSGVSSGVSNGYPSLAAKQEEPERPSRVPPDPRPDPKPVPAPVAKPEPPPLPVAPDHLIEKVIGALTESRRLTTERDQWEHLAVEAEKETARWRERAEASEAALRRLYDALGLQR